MTAGPLRDGAEVVEVVGRFVTASNITLLGVLDDATEVVYKPISGERPLWDFPMETLAAREVLTCAVDRSLAFDLVPDTVYGTGPMGPGAVQRYEDVDPDFDAVPEIRRAAPRLWPVAVLDVVCNNADRKIGHILERPDGSLVAVDHGLTFHPDDKLRTVLWTFAGRSLPDSMHQALEALDRTLHDGLGDRVRSLLGTRELDALRARVSWLQRTGIHPEPPSDRPPLPWPPY